MADVILYLFYWFSDTLKARYPDGFTKPFVADNVKMEDAVYHFNLYNGIGGHFNVVAAVLAFAVSAWFSFMLVFHLGMIVQAIYKEFITDGHWKRIKAGTETEAELLDFKADLITRGAGMIFPILGAVLILALRL